MTYREFVRSALPPAPETPQLRRLRLVTMATCFIAAFALVAARALDNEPPVLALVSLALGLSGFGLVFAFLRRKVRHDLAYWTPERVAFHRTSGTLLPLDRAVPAARVP